MSVLASSSESGILNTLPISGEKARHPRRRRPVDTIIARAQEIHLLWKDYELTVDLEAQQVHYRRPRTRRVVRFLNLKVRRVGNDDIDPFRKENLVQGLDDIGLTLQNEAAIDAFESAHS